MGIRKARVSENTVTLRFWLETARPSLLKQIFAMENEICIMLDRSP